MIEKFKRRVSLVTYKGHKRLKKVREVISKNKKKTVNWIILKKKMLWISFLVIIIFTIFNYFGWFGLIGIFFIKVVLGLKVGAAKTFGVAVLKAGGYKVLVSSLLFVVAKRFAIDKIMEIFKKDGLEKFGHNLFEVIKIKTKPIREAKIVTIVIAGISTIIGMITLKIFAAKLITTILQKLLIPLIGIIFSFLTQSLNFITNTLIFFIEGVIFTGFLSFIQKWSWGKKLSNGIDWIISKFIKFFEWLNYILRMIKIDTRKWFLLLARKSKIFRKQLIWLSNKIRIKIHITPKVWLRRLSRKFNNWLTSIIDKNINQALKLINKRKRYINNIEKISVKRMKRYIDKKERNVSVIKKNLKKIKKAFSFNIERRSFKLKITKKTTMIERVEKIKEKRKNKKKKNKVSKYSIFVSKRQVKMNINSLDLPYHDMIRNKKRNKGGF